MGRKKVKFDNQTVTISLSANVLKMIQALSPGNRSACVETLVRKEYFKALEEDRVPDIFKIGEVKNADVVGN